MSRAGLCLFVVYLYTGRLEPTDPLTCIELFGAGVNYKLHDTAEIDYLAMEALEKLLNAQNVAEVRHAAELRGIRSVIEYIDSNYNH